MSRRCDKARDRMSANVSVREVRSHRFMSEGRTVFTLTDGIIVGRTKPHDGKTTYSVPALEVLKKFLETANAQDAAAVRALAEARLGKVLA